MHIRIAISVLLLSVALWAQKPNVANDTQGNLPVARVAGWNNADWNASAGKTKIDNKPALPANTTSTTHQFFNAYTSATGVFGKAQPACGDLSDAGTLCQSSATIPEAIPSGMIAFVKTGTCPTGWTEETALAGNFVLLTKASNADVGGTTTFAASGSASNAVKLIACSKN